MAQGFTKKVVKTKTEDYQVKIDDKENGITYIGKALPGLLSSSAVWQIKRVDETADPDLDILFADGVNTFTKIWDNRETYSYS